MDALDRLCDDRGWPIPQHPGPVRTVIDRERGKWRRMRAWDHFLDPDRSIAGYCAERVYADADIDTEAFLEAFQVRARSGEPRQAPLAYVAHQGGYDVAGSNFGLSHHPAWTANLLRNPRAVVTTAGQHIQVTARLTQGAEHEQIWRFFLDLYPGYQTISDRSGRDLRIFHLQPFEP